MLYATLQRTRSRVQATKTTQPTTQADNTFECSRSIGFFASQKYDSCAESVTFQPGFLALQPFQFLRDFCVHCLRQRLTTDFETTSSTERHFFCDVRTFVESSSSMMSQIVAIRCRNAAFVGFSLDICWCFFAMPPRTAFRSPPVKRLK